MAKHCVNHKNKDVIDVANRLGVNPLVAASKIALWQEKNGLENFPVVKDSQLVSKPVYEKVNLNNLENSNAKPLYDTIDGNSTKATTSAVSTLFNNKSNITVDEVLENIQAQVPNIDTHTAELIKRAGKLVKKSKAQVKFVPESRLVSDDTVMQYEANSNTIEVSKDRLDRVNTKEAVVAFLHEVVHGQTVQAIAKDPKDRTFAEQELVDIVQNFMKVHKDSPLAQKYGFTNEFEFVAEFYANPEFRDEVKLTSDRWWNKILDAVRRLFDLPKNRQYQELFDTIINFVEETQLDVDGLKRYDRIFEKRLEKEPEFATFESALTQMVSKAQDKIDNVISKLEKSIRFKTSLSKQTYLEETKELSKELEKYETTNQLKAVVGYVKSFQRSVRNVEKLITGLENTKDIEKDDLLETIDRYQEYIAAYDLLPNIKELLGKGAAERSKMSAEEQKDFDELKDLIRSFELEHDLIQERFLRVKQAQLIKIFSDPKYNTEVETKHRRELTKEYKALTDKQGMSLNEYIHKMLTTRDKDDYEADLRASALKRINDPSIDISASSRWLSDNINTNSRIIQIVNNIITEARLKVNEAFKDLDTRLSKTYDDFIKSRSSKKPSEMYKNLLVKDANGKWHLRGKYSIEYKNRFESQLKPVLDARKEFVAAELKKGIDEKQIKKMPEYKAYNKEIAKWFKANTKKDYVDDGMGGLKKITKPKDFYLLKPLADPKEQSLLEDFRRINEENHQNYKGNNSLIQKIIGAEFHSLPSIEKSDLERRIEGDFKGLVKDKVTDFYKVKTDDVGVQTKAEKIDSRNKIVRDVKVHYRGEIKPENQSLDLMTIFRKEAFNGLNYASKVAIKPQLNTVLDVVEAKDYYKTDSAGKRILDKFAKRNPQTTYTGQFSQEYERLVGLVERTLYDTFAEHGGTFLGGDVNKMTSTINGVAASISMSFNLASGVTNALNGFTQLFIESFGGDKITKSSLLKAEAKYLKELPSLLDDLTNPTKKSYFNQLLEMFDVMGGLDPAEQESLRNSYLRKLGSTKMLNVLNESGEHMMHSILTEAILDGIKVMNEHGQYINKDGVVTTKEEAASMVDMLSMDDQGILRMSDKVVYSDFNLSTKYNEGGKTHVSLVIKKKVFDIFGVYDVKFKNEVSKYWWGKMIMMFKNFFISGAQYRFHGMSTSLKKQEDLSDDELFYSSAEKEYIEGTYTTFIRFMKNGVIPTLKDFSLMYMKDNYNNLTDYEKANLKKATLEFMLTSVILPSIGLLLAGAAGDDDDSELLWFAIYTNRRLTQELAQFRNPLEATKMISNPIAGSRIVNNALLFGYDILTPVNFMPVENESFLGYLDETSKGENKMVKHGKKLVPIWTQMDKNYKQLHALQFQ